MENHMVNKFCQWARAVNARIARKDFVQKIKEGNENDIRETIVVKILQYVLFAKNGQFQQCLEQDKILYRARIIEKESCLSKKYGCSINFDGNIMGFNYENSKEPPEQSAGRINEDGEKALYLAGSELTACAEVKAEPTSLISVATFRTKRPLNLIDFYDNVSVADLRELEKKYELSAGVLMTEVMYLFSLVNDYEGSIYKCTRYIAKMVREAGYDGIKYGSSLACGYNICLFESADTSVDFVASKLQYFGIPLWQIWDVNSGDQLQCCAKSDPDMEEIKCQIESIINRQNKM